jgi:hypothetical protein
VSCRNGFAVYLDLVFSADRGLAAKNLHTRIHENSLIHPVQAVDLAVLVGDQARPVEARLRNAEAEVGGVLQVVAEMRGVGKQLLRNAADVDAGAAEAVRFGDRDARAERGRDAAGAYPAGAAADGEKVVVERQATAGTT